MSHITVFSEDRVFSELLLRNLQHRGHEVAIHLVNRRSLESRDLAGIMSADDLLILDLAWYDPSRLETYRKIADLCGQLPTPLLLLVDGTWTEGSVAAFSAAITLRKPFGIDRVIQAVEPFVISRDG